MAYPVENTVMVNSGDSLNGSKAHAVEGHGDTKGFDLCSVTHIRVLSKLATAVAAQIALFTVTVSILDYLVAGTMRAVHIGLIF